MDANKRGTFSSKLGFVLAAAGSAVGLGNIWRFPYLAANYGGGMFLLVYIILAASFGFTMIVTEAALGRMTKKSPVGAFRKVGAGPVLRVGGWINAVIPILIVPYYSVIGGWVFKYLVQYIQGDHAKLACDNLAEGQTDFFTIFLGDAGQQLLYFVLFTFITMAIIFAGVKNGIEKISKIAMPILVVLCLITVAFSVTRPGAMEGVKYFLVPDISHFSWKTVVAALGQMFYSLSIAMGILVTFGSYMQPEQDIEASTRQVSIFDTAIAVMAGLMIIPAVFAYNGGEGLTKGPSLMFIAIPNVFNSMSFGRAIGIVFFLLVLFAALTSSVALGESVVSTFCDELKWGRRKASVVTLVITLVLGSISALGFNILSNVKILNMDLLSFFDFLTNNLMMPVAAISTCILILRVVKLNKLEEEVLSSSKFRMRKFYRVVIKYFAIPFLIIILVTSVLGEIASAFDIKALMIFKL